jgi:predicted permease
LQTLAARLSADFPESNFGKHFRAVRLADDLVADVRSALWFILGAVSLVLLIACANVANLLMVRSETRRGEIAVRAALGASRSRLAGEVLAESVVLSLAGALVGLLLASLGLALVRRIPAGILPRIETVSVDTTVLLFTLGVSMIVALFFGMGPALMQARGPLASSLVSTQRSGDSRHARRFRSVLLTFEVALSLVLLTGAGLVLKSFDRMYRVELGFETQQLTRFQLMLTGEKYRPIDAIVGFFGRLEERLAAVPGVESVGSVYGAPFGSENISGEVLVEGRPPAEPGQKLFGSMHAATPGYARTAGIPLLRGRWIAATDGVSSLPVAVVSEEFASRVFPGQDPIGQRLRVTADFGYGSHIWTVVGVAGDVKRGVQRDPLPEVYVPLPQFGPGQLHVLLRMQAGAAPPMQSIRDIVRQLDHAIPVRSLETVSAAVSREVAPTRFYMLMLAIFAAVAMLLASVGLYGVVAYLVSRRTREIGVRMALGARRGQVIAMVLRQGMQPAALGLAAGLVLTLALGRLASSLLFQVSPRDPAIMAAGTALLAVVALIAVSLPARRASRVDPVKALRVE